LLLCVLFSGLFFNGTRKKKRDFFKTAESRWFLKRIKRIKIRTVAGRKIIANYTIVNNETIMIKKQTVALDSIVSISNIQDSHPFLASLCCCLRVGTFVTVWNCWSKQLLLAVMVFC
jgi:hypothetical protein